MLTDACDAHQRDLNSTVPSRDLHDCHRAGYELVLALHAIFAKFALRINCLLAVHKDFLALNVHVVPPMRDDNSSDRGLGPIITFDTAGSRRPDVVLMSRSLRALNTRLDVVSV